MHSYTSGHRNPENMGVVAQKQILVDVMKLVTRSSKQNASHVMSCGSLARTSVGVACGRLMEVRVL